MGNMRYLEDLISQYICELDPKRVEKGGKHVVEMVAVDGCGNETVVRDTFVW